MHALPTDGVEGPRLRRQAGLATLGFAGSAALTVGGARLTGGTVSWWFSPRILPSFDGNEVLLYGGMAAVVLAWVLLGALGRAATMRPQELWLIAGLWALPLALGAPLFSHDVYSYLAQGTIAHAGLNPYHRPPTVLAHLGHGHVLSAVSPFWRHTTAPYGPLFVALVGLLVGVTGSHLIAGALAVRGLELIGLGLLAMAVARLARRFGWDPARATWLVLLNPLVLLQLVAPAHNDTLMVGLMTAGLVIGLERRPALGIVFCALAATIKLPALAAALFLTVAWARSASPGLPRVRILAASTLIVIGVIGLVSLISGFGVSWISSAVFSTPRRVHLAITPATAVGFTIAHVLHAVGIAASTHRLESALGVVSLALVAIFALQQLHRARFENLPLRLGLALLAVAVGGPAAWPWYLTWGIAVLAVYPARWVTIGVAVISLLGAFVVKPDGILVLSEQSSPFVLCAYLIAAAATVYAHRHRMRPGASRTPPRSRLPAASELARSR
jgi:hypothetical protein